MRAPATYIVIGMPGTFETATLATGGIALARPERPYIDASPDISHGAPNDGKSVGMAALKLPIIVLAAADDALIAFSRSIGSSTSVASVITVMETWLFASVLPCSRSDTGTAAVSDFFGSASYSRR